MTSVAFNCKECGTLVHLTSYQGTPNVGRELCFRCLQTGLSDKNNHPILLHDTVRLDGLEFEVIRNDFTKEIVIDGDTGQALLQEVCKQCEVVKETT